MTTKRKTKLTITIVAVLIAVTHILFPKINIDLITVVLIVLAIIPWLEILFKSVELPGGLKLEFQDLQKLGDEAKKAGLIKPETKDEEQIKKEVSIYPFVEIAEQNQELALVSLRIEIEKRLRDIATKYGIETKKYSILNLINTLSSKGILSIDENSSLRDMIITLNQAAHGVEYDQRNADWVIENGPKIMESLDNKIEWRGGKFSHNNPEAKEHWIDKSFRECNWTTNYEWGECIKKHTELWEKELENIYSVLLKKLTSDKNQKLIQTQEHWKKQFDLEKYFFYSFDDLQHKVGREGMFISAITFMDKIRERTLELEEVLTRLI